MSLALEGPIVERERISPKERVAYAAVLVPGQRDRNGEPPLTKAEIRRYAHGYLQNFRHMDEEHSLDVESGSGVPVESWIVPDGVEIPVTMEGRRVVLPEGTWIIGSKASPRTWAKIRSGEITGYSIAGFSMKEYREALATKATRPGIRRVLLRDLEEPMVGIVSYVRSPAVADAKFFALKSQRPDSEALRPSETLRDQIAALAPRTGRTKAQDGHESGGEKSELDYLETKKKPSPRRQI